MNLSKYNYFSRRQFIGKGGYSELSKVAAPLIVMSASNVVMMFCDRLFLARAGTDMVAAAMPVGMMYFTLFCLYSGIVSFTSPLVAQLFGANDRHGCVRASWNGFYIGLAASLIIILLNPLIGKYIILHSGMKAELIAPSLDYLDGLWLSGVFPCLAIPLFCFFSGRGVTWPAGVVSAGACVLNVVLDYMFIFGKWGAPEWGIYGGGVATSLASCFSFVCAAVLFLLLPDQKEYPTRRKFGFRWEYVRKIVFYGAPAGMQVMTEVGAFAFMGFLVGSISVEAAAATTIALSVNNFSFSPLLGFSDATAIVAGQYIGRNRHGISEHTVYRAWRICFIYMLLCGLVYLTFPEFLSGLFAPSGGGHGFEAVINLSVVILACAAVFNLTDSVKYVFMAGLRGAGDTVFVFLITTGAQWLIMVPGLYVIIHVLHGTVIQMWYFLTIYGSLEAALIFWRFRSGRWKKIKLIDR